MLAFMRAKERFTVHLRPEDIALDLTHDLDAVVEALGRLEHWGNLRADPDTGRVTSVEDFHRARYLYQLTPAGQAAEQAIAVYEDAIGRRGVLQSVALADIATQLRALLALTGNGAELDAAKTHLLLISVAERFSGLADNAQAFMASLRRTIDFADNDVDAFLAYKERLISYIERFIADLANSGAEIADLALRIEAAGVEPLLEVAARREAADAVPDGIDDEADAAVAEAMRHWRNRWAGLRSWFISADSRRPSQARLLRSAAIGAITQLLGAVAVINERRSGRSDRSADFRALARWFAQAPDEAATHQLWRAAFGLGPSRHLTVTAQTLDEWAEQRVAAATPWAQAPPLAVSPQLRRTGSYERRGQPNRVIDRADARRLLLERAAQEAAQTAAARARLVTDGPVLLSHLGQLDPQAFRLFLGLLGDALSARGPHTKEVRTTTGDGTMEVRLTLVDDAGLVEIHTTDGVLSGPQHLIDITDLTRATVSR
ncbi:uncharacterized protein (TIGR02677 family) [Longispora fulva]|uniref:Uncharacterized protein (TIGR02677 family) n=2 Tax=Longispora fulva TaxID=619741 RepID=A0A8J7GVM8_9ACTN|nr:uncharacterized protein (TIGR02677 family) [Longispora fulva]